MSTSTLKSDPVMAKTVEKQMRLWQWLVESYRKAPVAPPCPHPGPVKPFLTLSNSVGSGGREVAVEVGRRLNWPVFDRELLTVMAGDDEVRARLYQSMDERDVGWLEEALRGFMNEEFKRNDYFHRLTETLLCLARQGSAVFVGRAADLILPRDCGFRVWIVASHEYRVRAFAAHEGLDLHEAAKRMAAIDQERADFVQRHFHREAYDPARFDLVINIERLQVSHAVEVILTAMRVSGVGVTA